MSLCTLVFCTMLTMVQICCISQLAIGDAYWETENWSIMINSTQSIWKYLMCAPSIMQSRCSSWMHFMTPRVRESHKFMQWILAWNHGDPMRSWDAVCEFNSPINELTIWAHFQFMGKTSWIRKPRVQLLCCRPIWIGSCYVIHLHPSETSCMPFTCWSPCCLTLSVRLGCSRVHVRWVDAGAYELQSNNCLQYCP